VPLLTEKVLLMSESSPAPIAPPPLHTIRSHNSGISALFVSCDNERIYSGDLSGQVVITSTRTIRPLASWKAHTDGLLGVEEWGEQLQVITSVCGDGSFTSTVPLMMIWCLKATDAITSCMFGDGLYMRHLLSAADLRRLRARWISNLATR
jgi:hypothetical protein